MILNYTGLNDVVSWTPEFNDIILIYDIIKVTQNTVLFDEIIAFKLV